MTALLSTAYLPPVQYISKFLKGPVLIEQHENFQKQSFRNRCCIIGANGMQQLVIPVKKMHGEKMPVQSVEIDYSSPWVNIHKKSIRSAYQNSAYYEFYADDFNALYDTRVPGLFDWNMVCLKTIFTFLKLNTEILTTTGYIKNENEMDDYRDSISSKPRLYKEDPHFKPTVYQQVFTERFGFQPNLSIIDLIFNEGPRAKEILKMSLCQ
jgi:hypothetical protein